MAKYSDIGREMMSRTGVDDLMVDLFKALHTKGDLYQLNGGSPAFLEAMSQLWRTRVHEMVDSGEMERVLGLYGSPRGDLAFIDVLCNQLNDKYGWGITRKNVCITHGGQMAFFLLFNILAGRDCEQGNGRIMFPLCPDYIGYQGQSLCGGEMFCGLRPEIHHLTDRLFKYGVNFRELAVGADVRALCLSRPTNPTGNVVTDEEVKHLHEIATEADIPLMIDGAYGPPLPNICFVDAEPIWDENVVMTMSLSKLGLPGARTGIIIASEELVDTAVKVMTRSSLCPNNFGQAVVRPYWADGTLERLSAELLRPYYESRSLHAQTLLPELFGEDIPWRVHKSEGAMFLWIWFEGLPITAQELYERCRLRGCYINPGHHFFFALHDAEWRHQYECVRVSFTQDDAVVRTGMSILADEVRKAYGK